MLDAGNSANTVQGGYYETITSSDNFGISIKSAGIDHEVKQNLAFAVSGRAEVDDVKIWKLAAAK
ncbi:hypothetical protein [Rubritalea profundi]|uniref:Uncharacterized protein n=1 Tax=Rubritalea profundi TaxID=1658618 RepID=A0A2S7U3I0_9BACT|nr:hypothetical protein [Rubritalea profundi]PQJ29067.1 hypothetical protein BSZ32_11580 [Rubritalea profundi]